MLTFTAFIITTDGETAMLTMLGKSAEAVETQLRAAFGKVIKTLVVAQLVDVKLTTI